MNFFDSGKRIGTFVMVVLDPHDTVWHARHHAVTGESGLLNRVGGNIDVSVVECEADDDEVVNMLHVLADHSLGDVWMHAADDDVPGGSVGHLRCKI